MFLGNKNKDSLSEEPTKHTAKPFLKREKPIRDLDSLIERVASLKDCIRDCENEISVTSKDLVRITSHTGTDQDVKCRFNVVTHENDTLFSYSITTTGSEAAKLAAKTEYLELSNIIADHLESYFKSKLNYFEELKHTCENELDWLSERLKLNSSKLGWVDCNFDPEKDRV